MFNLTANGKRLKLKEIFELFKFLYFINAGPELGCYTITLKTEFNG